MLFLHGIREAVFAGLIIAVLTAVYSIILIKKGDNGEGGCASCSCGILKGDGECRKKDDSQ